MQICFFKAAVAEKQAAKCKAKQAVQFCEYAIRP